MARLFNRDIVVTLGAKRIASHPAGQDDVTKPVLRMAFKVEKKLTRDPNRTELQLWNLSEDSRALLQREKNIRVNIEAGYVGEIQQIFVGNLGYAVHTRSSNDWVTKLEAGDGLNAYRESRISESFGPGTQVVDVISRICDTMSGVGRGNVAKKLQEGGFREKVTEFPRGLTVVGQSAEELDKVMANVGLEYSIQDGQLQALKPGETTDESSIRLDLASGLVGSPELGADGIVKARSLLQGAIKPGRRVEILSTRPVSFERMESIAFVRVEKITHFGDTWGSDWYTELEGSQI